MLQQDLTQVFQEREQFKKELEACERQIEHLERTMKETDQERHQSMISYRKLIIEHERLDMLYKRSEDSAGSMRMEVMMRDKAIQSLQDTVSDANSEIMKLKGSLHATEKQIGSNLLLNQWFYSYVSIKQESGRGRANGHAHGRRKGADDAGASCLAGSSVYD